MIIARRAYCVGTSLISLFVRPVGHTQFWTGIVQKMHARASLRVQNRIRLGHFAKPHLMEDNPDVALDHFLTIPVSLRT